MTMVEIDPVLVVGGTGRVGRLVVRRLLAMQRKVFVLARDVEKAYRLFGAEVGRVTGDVGQPHTLIPAVAGIRSIVYCAGPRLPWGRSQPRVVSYEGVRDLADAAQKAGVAHLVLLTVVGGSSLHPLHWIGGYRKYQAQGEDALRRVARSSDGMAYTIVRVRRLTDAPGGQVGLELRPGRMRPVPSGPSGDIGRSDVAEVCVRALGSPTTHNTTFQIVAVEGQSPPTTDEEWAALFTHLTPDR